jgi:hypothetical protein
VDEDVERVDFVVDQFLSFVFSHLARWNLGVLQDPRHHHVHALAVFNFRVVAGIGVHEVVERVLSFYTGVTLFAEFHVARICSVDVFLETIEKFLIWLFVFIILVQGSRRVNHWPVVQVFGVGCLSFLHVLSKHAVLDFV